MLRVTLIKMNSSLQIGNHVFKWGSRTFVMGILNITPDSFSGDGLISSGNLIEQSLRQAGHFLKYKADILDIGGESTRPGSQTVSADEEMGRVIPVIQAISQHFPQALISIDTYKACVAQEAFEAGARILNDVWALRADPDLASVAKTFNAPSF